jgi:hypothetical protein
MANKGAKKQALSWTASAFLETDLKKMKKEGFLAESAEVIFPSTAVIPAPPPGFQVMSLAIVLHGFSVPAMQNGRQNTIGEHIDETEPADRCLSLTFGMSNH